VIQKKTIYSVFKYVSRLFISPFISIAVPERCVGCGSPVWHFENGICNECLYAIKAPEKACPKCSGIVSDGICAICGDRFWFPVRNIALTEYSGRVINIIKSIKFENRRRPCAHLARLSAEKIKYSGIKPDILTFVPASKNTRKNRGFNQSEVIARQISRRLGIPCKKCLKNIGKGPGQKMRGNYDRFIAILGSFKAIKTDKFAGKKILLVDDVFTTGATVNECARTLIEAGAGSVFSFTVARSPIKSLITN
jgi:ComF family protein